jgi:hypothetical protein
VVTPGAFTRVDIVTHRDGAVLASSFVAAWRR